MFKKTAGRPAGVSRQRLTPITYIVRQGTRRTSHQRGQTLLGALAANQHKAVIDMDITHIEPHQLAHAKAAPIQHFQDGVIAQAHLAIRKILVEQCRNILHRKALRQALGLFWQTQCRRGILGHSPIAHQKGMQAFDGRECALHRSVGIAPVAPIGDKVLDDPPAHILKGCNARPLQIGTVSRQVSAIGGNRVARQAPLDCKVIKKLPRRHSERRRSLFDMFPVRWQP